MVQPARNEEQRGVSSMIQRPTGPAKTYKEWKMQRDANRQRFNKFPEDERFSGHRNTYDSWRTEPPRSNFNEPSSGFESNRRKPKESKSGIINESLSTSLEVKEDGSIQDHPRQDHPRQDHSTQEHSRPDHSSLNHPRLDHSSLNHPRQDHPRQDHPRQDQPRQDHPSQDHPRQNHPRWDHSRQDLPRQDLPRQDHPRQDHPRQDHLRQDHPRQDHPRQDHPRQDHPRQDHLEHAHLRWNHPCHNEKKPGPLSDEQVLTTDWATKLAEFNLIQSKGPKISDFNKGPNIPNFNKGPNIPGSNQGTKVSDFNQGHNLSRPRKGPHTPDIEDGIQSDARQSIPQFNVVKNSLFSTDARISPSSNADDGYEYNDSDSHFNNDMSYSPSDSGSQSSAHIEHSKPSNLFATTSDIDPAAAKARQRTNDRLIAYLESMDKRQKYKFFESLKKKYYERKEKYMHEPGNRRTHALKAEKFVHFCEVREDYYFVKEYLYKEKQKREASIIKPIPPKSPDPEVVTLDNADEDPYSPSEDVVLLDNEEEGNVPPIREVPPPVRDLPAPVRNVSPPVHGVSAPVRENVEPEPTVEHKKPGGDLAAYINEIMGNIKADEEIYEDKTDENLVIPLSFNKIKPFETDVPVYKSPVTRKRNLSESPELPAAKFHCSRSNSSSPISSFEPINPAASFLALPLQNTSLVAEPKGTSHAKIANQNVAAVMPSGNLSSDLPVEQKMHQAAPSSPPDNDKFSVDESMSVKNSLVPTSSESSKAVSSPAVSVPQSICIAVPPPINKQGASRLLERSSSFSSNRGSPMCNKTTDIRSGTQSPVQLEVTQSIESFEPLSSQSVIATSVSEAVLSHDSDSQVRSQSVQPQSLKSDMEQFSRPDAHKLLPTSRETSLPPSTSTLSESPLEPSETAERTIFPTSESVPPLESENASPMPSSEVLPPLSPKMVPPPLPSEGAPPLPFDPPPPLPNMPPPDECMPPLPNYDPLPPPPMPMFVFPKISTPIKSAVIPPKPTVPITHESVVEETDKRETVRIEASLKEPTAGVQIQRSCSNDAEVTSAIMEDLNILASFGVLPDEGFFKDYAKDKFGNQSNLVRNERIVNVAEKLKTEYCEVLIQNNHVYVSIKLLFGSF